MKFIAVDFEWNQAQSSGKTYILEDGKRLSGEIIQIGAVKLDENMNIESMFKTEIKPGIYTKMNNKVSELTGITGEMLEKAPTFSECIKKFTQWCEDTPVFLTWGVDDIRVLRQNCSINSEPSDFCKEWYNMQVFFNMQTDTGTNQKSLASAVEYFNIENTLRAHDALNDAYYTAIIAKHLDVKKGMAEYPGAKCALCGSDKGKTVFKGIKSRRAAITNKAICNPSCPVCDKQFSEIAPLVRVNRFKYLGIGKCAEHGEFSIKLRISPQEDGSKNIYRTVRECTEKDTQQYDTLVNKEIERQLARADAEKSRAGKSIGEESGKKRESNEI